MVVVVEPKVAVMALYRMVGWFRWVPSRADNFLHLYTAKDKDA
jgi:hypothetical protein